MKKADYRLTLMMIKPISGASTHPLKPLIPMMMMMMMMMMITTTKLSLTLIKYHETYGKVEI
jgi:hypothetical protein